MIRGTRLTSVFAASVGVVLATTLALAAPASASQPPVATLAAAHAIPSATPNGLAATPPMGWNDWYTFFCNINEQLIQQTADAMVSSGMQAAGYDYVNLDDCWLARTRDANGNLQPDLTKFPHGIKALADYVHARGLKLGIYEDVARPPAPATPAATGTCSRTPTPSHPGASTSSRSTGATCPSAPFPA